MDQLSTIHVDPIDTQHKETTMLKDSPIQTKHFKDYDVTTMTSSVT